MIKHHTWKWEKHDGDMNENNMFFVLYKTSDERPLMKTCLHHIKDLQEGTIHWDQNWNKCGPQCPEKH